MSFVKSFLQEGDKGSMSRLMTAGFFVLGFGVTIYQVVSGGIELGLITTLFGYAVGNKQISKYLENGKDHDRKH